MARVKGPLQDDSFEYMLDYYNNKSSIVTQLLDEFDSVNISKKLVESAAYWNTPPNQFLEEIGVLLSLEKEQRSGSKGNYGTDPEKRITYLRKKYNISDTCVLPDCVSISRLAFVFPHLGLIDEKPIFNRKEVQGTGSSSEQIFVVEPKIFQNPLFGGIIPFRNGPDNPVTDSSVLRVIITVHLYYLQDSLYKNETVPIHSQCIMLLKRMEKSLLSNKRRVRLLKVYDVITEKVSSYNNEALRDGVSAAYDHIPSDFKNSVANWLVPVSAQAKSIKIPAQDW